MVDREKLQIMADNKSIVKVQIEFDIALDDCTPKTLNQIGQMLIQHGQALILTNDSNKDTIEENEDCCLPFY